jgi:DNA mismatch endonuclease, patch repair protein
MDRVSPEERSRIMSAIRNKDMKPEVAVRRLVHRMGYRYKLHEHALPGRPDMVFVGRRKIIFVHGCFWHQHGSDCKLTHVPRSNLSYWQPKLERNKARDIEHCDALRSAAWDVLIIWECEIGNRGLERSIRRFLEDRPGRGTKKKNAL